MTVSAQTPINRSAGNGVTTIFPYTFKIISDGDIEVSVDDAVKTLNVDYTVSGAGLDAGGNVTMTTAPASGTTVVRRRNMAIVRTTDYQDQGTLPAATLDSDVDSTVLMIQQLDERLDRTFSLPASSSADSAMPAPTGGYVLGWDALGENLVNLPASAGTSLIDLAASSGSSLVGFIQSGTGAVATTVQTKLRESVSASDFAGYDSTGATDSATAINNALAAASDVLIIGTPSIASTITIPAHKRLWFQGGDGIISSSLPPSYITKKASMTTAGIILSSGATLEGGGLVCEVGNTGDGIRVEGNRFTIRNTVVFGAGNDGIRVGTDAGGNFNVGVIEKIVSNENGRYGLNIDDGKASTADANCITVTNSVCDSNASHGVHIGNAFFNTFIGLLTQSNGGYGLYLSPVITYGGVAKCRYNTFVGGDFDEGNTSGSAYFGGYACTLYLASQNQDIEMVGLFCNLFGSGNDTELNNIGVTGLRMPAAVGTGTITSNTMTVYEEGTFVPVVIGTSTAGVATYTQQLGRYTRIGRQVFFDIYLAYSAGTGTGNLRVTGLPFASNASTYGCVTVGQISNIALTASNVATAFIDPSAIYISLNQYPVGGGAASAVAYDAAGTILLSGSYSR